MAASGASPLSIRASIAGSVSKRYAVPKVRGAIRSTEMSAAAATARTDAISFADAATAHASAPIGTKSTTASAETAASRSIAKRTIPAISSRSAPGKVNRLNDNRSRTMVQMARSALMPALRSAKAMNAPRTASVPSITSAGNAISTHRTTVARPRSMTASTARRRRWPRSIATCDFTGIYGL